MKKELFRRLSVVSLAAVLGLAMTFTPGMAGISAFAAEVDTQDTTNSGLIVTDEMYDQLDGMKVSKAQKDAELAPLLDDPVFMRYFDITDNGVIKKKDTETDEVDLFIKEMDKNAEGIDNTEIAEMNSEMNCVGCGVSGLGKAKVPSKYSSVKKSNCIDISWWQGKVTDANWKKIKDAGVTHAILRVGYSSLSGGAHNSDSVFSNNINGAYKAGIKVGVYYYSTATTAAEAKSEAQYTVKLLEAYKSKITLPVAFDYETGGRLTSSVMKKNGTASCKAYCDYIKSAGYTPMVYANYVTLTNYLDYKTLQSKYKIWLANYTTSGSATTYPGEYWMWQYSSSGKVNGLSGSIDINYIFDNGQGGQTTTATNTTTTTSASSTTTSTTSSSTTTTTTTKKSAFASYKAKTTTSLNYRTGPGTKYTKKGTLKKGATVTVVGVSGNWAKLSNGYYASLSYLKKVTTTASKSYTAKTTTSVNYRTGPGTSYAKKGTYSKGKKITIVSTKNGWGKMSNGYYIYLKYTKKL